MGQTGWGLVLVLLYLPHFIFLALALGSLGWSHLNIGFHDLGLCQLLPVHRLCPPKLAE